MSLMTTIALSLVRVMVADVGIESVTIASECLVSTCY